MKLVSIFMLSAALISVVAVSGQQGASGGGSPADILYAKPGQLVSVNGFRLNLYCMGSGSPTVIFDSGWGDWAPAWSKVQPQVAKWTRACSYDRAGTGFSDPGPMPRTSVRIAKELRTALHHAGIAGPYILVGSAFGGDNVRTFADLYMGEVAGLVLVDADPTDVEPKAMREDEHRRHAGIPSDLRNCRNAIVEHKLSPAASPGQPQPNCAQQFFFRGLPEAAWSPELNAKVLEIAQTKVAMYDAYSSEMEQTASDEIYLQQHRRSFGSRPIRVLTSGNHGVGHLERKPPDTPEHLKYEQETTLAQARWLELSSNAKQIFARNSSEYIQFDEPETVINAIREVFDRGSADESLPPRVVDLKASDGTVLKATYFAAANPGPGVLLFHQSNRTRDSWEGIARQLAAAGINTLTVDTRGRRKWSGDLDLAFDHLLSQPGVKRDTIGLGGAGALGVLGLMFATVVIAGVLETVGHTACCFVTKVQAASCERKH